MGWCWSRPRKKSTTCSPWNIRRRRSLGETEAVPHGLVTKDVLKAVRFHSTNKPVAGTLAIWGTDMANYKQIDWKCHTPLLLEEILKNDQCYILNKPLKIFGFMLGQVADRAVILNDPELNRLMCRLTLYSQADPESPDYDPEMLKSLGL